MKNILILLDYYLPNASPNGICCANVARELIHQGYSVSIVALSGSELDRAQTINDIPVYYCGNRSDRKKRSFDGVLYYAKWLSPYYKFPVTEDKMITAAYVQKCEELIERDQIDTLICVHLPVETLVAGTIFKARHPELTCIAYMLDSLSGGFLPRLLPQQYCRNRKIKWENALFTYFDRVILMESSRAHHERISKPFSWYAKSLYCDIPALVNRHITFERTQPKLNEFQICFVGTIADGIRDPYFFLRLLKYINTVRICLIFVGNNSCNPKHFNMYVDNLSFKTNLQIKCLGVLSHKEALKIISESSVMLNIGNTTNSMVPSKIFEYMSYGKPIISTYSIDNEACIPYLTKYPCALLLDERDPDLVRQAKALEAFILKTSDINMNFSDIKQLFYQNTPAAFVEALENAEK